MTTQLLNEYQVFHTRDLAEARARTSEMLWSHRLVAADANDVNARHNLVHFGYFSLHYIEYGPEMYISPNGIEDSYFVLVPLRGECQILSGRQQAAVGSGRAPQRR